MFTRKQGYAGVFVGIYLAVMSVNYVYIDRTEVRNAELVATRAVETVRYQHENLISTSKHLLVLLAHLPEAVRQDVEGCTARLLEIRDAEHGLYSNFAVLRTNGSALCSATPLPPGTSAADRPYFQRVMRTREFSVGEYQVSRASRRPAVIFAYPMTFADGSLGAVLADIELERLTDLVSSNFLPSDSSISLVDRNGIVLVQVPAGVEKPGEPLSSVELRTALSRGVSGNMRVRGVDGIERIFAFAPLHGSESGSSVSLVLGVPRLALLDRFNRIFWFDAAGLIAMLWLASHARSSRHTR